MGNKTYFEFLEEEFQVLASRLGTNLSKIASDPSYDNPEEPKAVETAGKQIRRCEAVLRQLQAESRKDREFRDRSDLYKMQLDALKEEFKRHNWSI